jgi:hypothetical protein
MKGVCMDARTVAVLLLVVLGPAGLPGCRPASPGGESKHVRYVMGLSPFLADDAKDPAFRHIAGFLLEDMPLNSSLWIYDAYSLKTITHVEIPRVRAFESGKTRANQFRDNIHQLKQFLARTHSKPEAGNLDFTQAVRLPQFLEFVGRNLTGPDHSVMVLILGGPLYLDDKEPAFAMADGYFPSDAHLLATRDKSVFGLKDCGESLQGITVHLGYFGDPWASAIHQEKVVRFWNLYLSQQGARQGAFTGDLPTVFHAALRGGQPPEGHGPRYEIDPTQTKVEMRRISRDVGVSDWITQELPANHRPPPPSTTVGPMRIGIRWQNQIDLDLYARPTPDGETLYFEHMRSPEGYYFKDHRSSPDREYEFIEFLKPVDVWQAEASINFYDGSVPRGPEGEIRVEFNGRIYSTRFSIESDRGNRGRSGRGQDDYWVTIDIPKMLGLR